MIRRLSLKSSWMNEAQYCVVGVRNGVVCATGTRGPGRFAGMIVHRERKFAIDHPEIKFLLELVDRFGQLTARRTLEIAEFFKRHGRIGRTENMSRFRFASRPLKAHGRRLGQHHRRLVQCAA